MSTIGPISANASLSATSNLQSSSTFSADQKNSIQSIKENSSVEYDIIVFIDGDNDRTEQWCKENNIIYFEIKDILNLVRNICTIQHVLLHKLKQ